MENLLQLVFIGLMDGTCIVLLLQLFLADDGLHSGSHQLELNEVFAIENAVDQVFLGVGLNSDGTHEAV